MEKLKIDAKVENLDHVIGILEEKLETMDCPFKIVTQLSIALEEIFVNIAHYAYESEGAGWAELTFEKLDGGKGISIALKDGGRAYNPLAKEDPDVTLGAEERQIGGLGIFMVKKSMDKVSYEYKDGCNIFTMEKSWGD